MNKKIIIFAALLTSCLNLSGCFGQGKVRYYGGTMEIKLPENQKLEEITWKDDSLWYLTRPMRPEENAETHKFQQDTTFGIFEGTVIITEVKKEESVEE